MGVPGVAAAPNASSPMKPNRARPQPRLLSSSLQASRRGMLHVTHAGAAFYQHEWELYRAENDFHQRTLRLVHQVTQTIRHEWDLYRAEMGQLLVAPSSQLTDEAKEAAYNQVVQLVEEAVAAEAGTGYDSAEEGMHPGKSRVTMVGWQQGRCITSFSWGLPGKAG